MFWNLPKAELKDASLQKKMKNTAVPPFLALPQPTLQIISTSSTGELRVVPSPVAKLDVVSTNEEEEVKRDSANEATKLDYDQSKIKKQKKGKKIYAHKQYFECQVSIVINVLT